MTEILVRRFIKHHQDIKSSHVREQYGTLSSLVGIACNVLLFCLKFTIGTLSNSLSIVSDAFNNLSDSANCIVTLVGYKIAAKPADKDHPFGHGRVEYLASLIVASVIVYVGFEFLRASVGKIIQPEPVTYSHVALVALLASIAIKFWMYGFNTKLGKRIHSPGMLATAKDSLVDVVATSVTLLTLLFSVVSDVSIDGYAGLLVSGFILYSGYDIIRDTVDTLLGKQADQETLDAILSIIKIEDDIIGVHDLIVHNYGPGKMLATVHVEVRADADMLHAHEQIDEIERDILEQLGILMVVHMDPIDTNNELRNEMNSAITMILKQIDERLSSHDFRLFHQTLIFDVEVPYEISMTNNQMQEIINLKFKQQFPDYETRITFDRSFL